MLGKLISLPKTSLSHNLVFDEIINEERIDLIKIDVEGAEDLVLEGARNCLKITKTVTLNTMMILS